MSDCVLCDWIEQKKNVLFETETHALLLAPEPCAAGHMVVVPKKHAPIIEAVDDAVLGDMFVLANKASMCVFEGLGAQGSNLLIQNGVVAGQSLNHAMIHVIPRFENDGVELSWTPTKATPDELDSIIAQLTSEKAEPEPQEKKVENKPEYVLRRIP